MKLIYFILLFLTCISCQKHTKFDKNIWNSGNVDDKLTYELRNEMLDDLLNNYNLKGKDVQEIEKIIGEADSKNSDDRKSENAMIYTILVKWRGIDPVYYKYLNLHFNENKIVDSIFISERKVN